MPGVDWIPGVSQVKSLCQLVTGDVDGALKTQENFAKECPVASQITSVVQVVSGDTDGALETQQRCLGTLNNVANGIPVVGHIKGGVHHALGDHEGGNQALLAATRSSVVIGSGVAAGMASGGLAAIPAGIAAGSAYDLADTAISDKPKGVCAVVQHAVDNPNAGNIFDAAAVFVGDGLAGYSGGQIGKQISTQVKLNNLEAARASTYDKLDAGMFPEKGASSMTSGQLTSLGNQINAFTAEINAIRHGTPQYWFDPKSNQVVMTTSKSGFKCPPVNVPQDGSGRGQASGSRRQDDEYEYNSEENGLQSDCYAGEIEVAHSAEYKKEKKAKYVNQKPGQKQLKNQYPNTTISDQKRNQPKENFDRDNDPNQILNQNTLELLTKSTWHHVQMPKEFGYTGAIVSKDAFQGLMHTFIRHWDQWEEYIPGLNDLMERLPERIRHFIHKVRDARNPKVSGNATNELNEAIRNLPNDLYIDVQTILHEIEMKIYKFLQDNVTFDQYLEEGMNNRGLIQVYFKVKDRKGNTKVMVVCVSEQLYPSVFEFGDERPVRTITTVFFKTLDKHNNYENLCGKCWPKK